jgi:hypothetical protein
VAISPDVVSFVHCRFGYCDLLWSSGIRNVARKASRVSLAFGMARNLLRRCPGRRKPWPPSPPSPRPGLTPPQLAGFSFRGDSMRSISYPQNETGFNLF